MSKDLLERIKNVILVVLFVITILLLYLSYNQSGTEFSLSEILPGGRNTGIVINMDEYLAPRYTVKSSGHGRYLITYKNQKQIFETASECAGVLLSSSNINISQITDEEYEAVSQEDNSIQLIFDFNFPFDDYCMELIGKKIDKPEALCGFRGLMFSDKIKSDLYMRTLDGECFKISVAENYYSTEALSRVLSFDGGEVRFRDIYQLNFRSIGQESAIDFDSAAEAIFGETLDFVRKITDGQGNTTYMYGYGQKRLSVYADGGLEFKEEISGLNEADFYHDLETGLRFITEKFGLDESLVRLKQSNLVSDDSSEYYSFSFETEKYQITAEIKASTVKYISVSLIN